MIIAPASGYTIMEEAWQERKKIVFYWLSRIIRRDAVIWGDHNKVKVLK